MEDTVEVTVGVVGRAHGIKGDATIDVRTDEASRRFTPGARLTTESGRALELVRVKWHQGRLLVAFDGYPDRTAVETLRGEVLTARVPASERPSEEDEYFDRHLVGLAVLDATGERVGTVTSVEHFPAQDLLTIDVAGEDRLVPFVSQLVPRVDLKAGELQLADVAGLLEDVE